VLRDKINPPELHGKKKKAGYKAMDLLKKGTDHAV
jgi:hypothetical protein